MIALMLLLALEVRSTVSTVPLMVAYGPRQFCSVCLSSVSSLPLSSRRMSAIDGREEGAKLSLIKASMARCFIARTVSPPVILSSRLE